MVFVFIFFFLLIRSLWSDSLNLISSSQFSISLRLLKSWWRNKTRFVSWGNSCSNTVRHYNAALSHLNSSNCAALARIYISYKHCEPLKMSKTFSKNSRLDYFEWKLCYLYQHFIILSTPCLLSNHHVIVTVLCYCLCIIYFFSFMPCIITDS